MKTTKQYLSVGIVLVAISILLVLVFGVATPAISSATFNVLAASTVTPTPPPGDIIPLESISDLTSLNATAWIEVNGLIDGKRTQGNLNALLTTNDQEKSRATVSGSLLGDIAAQVGGSLLGLFTPSTVDIYKVPAGTFIVANSLFPVCVKHDTAEATATLDEMSPQSLLSMLTSSDVARGQLVGEETLNGVPVDHYVLNGDAFLAATQNSTDPQLSTFGEALWSAEDADLYIDPESGYPVAFRGSYSGEYEPLKFEGDFEVQIEVTGVNTNTPVDLPASCNNPISR
jgi:hypothetical protein